MLTQLFAQYCPTQKYKLHLLVDSWLFKYWKNVIPWPPPSFILSYMHYSVFKTGLGFRFSNNKVWWQIFKKILHRKPKSMTYFIYCEKIIIIEKSDSLVIICIHQSCWIEIFSKIRRIYWKYKKPVNQSWVKTLFNYVFILEEHRAVTMSINIQ